MTRGKTRDEGVKERSSPESLPPPSIKSRRKLNWILVHWAVLHVQPAQYILKGTDFPPSLFAFSLSGIHPHNITPSSLDHSHAETTEPAYGIFYYAPWKKNTPKKIIHPHVTTI